MEAAAREAAWKEHESACAKEREALALEIRDRIAWPRERIAAAVERLRRLGMLRQPLPGNREWRPHEYALVAGADALNALESATR
jgi:hypothetical protein